MNEEIKEYIEDVEESKPKKAKKISVTLLNSRVHIINGIKHYLAVTNDGRLEGYLVPTDAVKYDTSNPQDLKNPDEYIKVYDWEDEIDSMLPDIDTIRRNVLLSFWRAGAIDATDVPNEIKRRMLSSAFPYPIPFKEND